jgi:hypothetical protein
MAYTPSYGIPDGHKEAKASPQPTATSLGTVWRGRTLEEAAARTIKQARELAEFYERSFLEFFFRADPPTLAEPTLVPDYRMIKNVETDATDRRELEVIQAWAEEKRTNALDLFDDLGDKPPELPNELFVTLPASSRRRERYKDPRLSNFRTI